MTEQKETSSFDLSSINFEKVKDTTLMYANLMSSSRTLIDNFLLLFLKKNDAKLENKTKQERDKAEKVIFWTSISGKLFSCYYLGTRLSFLNQLPFNPIKDFRVMLVAYGALYLADSLPIAYFWRNFEPYVMKLNPYGEEIKDIYADNIMNSARIFFYKKLV